MPSPGGFQSLAHCFRLQFAVSRLDLAVGLGQWSRLRRAKDSAHKPNPAHTIHKQSEGTGTATSANVENVPTQNAAIGASPSTFKRDRLVLLSDARRTGLIPVLGGPRNEEVGAGACSSSGNPVLSPGPRLHSKVATHLEIRRRKENVVGFAGVV